MGFSFKLQIAPRKSGHWSQLSHPLIQKPAANLSIDSLQSFFLPDVTIDPSMLSLSEAIMNMSTNVNNEELAKAIIEISKKKKEGRMKKKDDRKM